MRSADSIVASLVNFVTTLVLLTSFISVTCRLGEPKLLRKSASSDLATAGRVLSGLDAHSGIHAEEKGWEI
jgi:hypothetical protein